MTRKAVGRIGITVGLLLGAAGWAVAAQGPSPANSKAAVSHSDCVKKRGSDGKAYFECTVAVLITTTFHDSTGVGGGIPKQDIRFKVVGSR